MLVNGNCRHSDSLTFVEVGNGRGGIEEPAPQDFAGLSRYGEGEEPCKRPHFGSMIVCLRCIDLEV